MEFPSVSNPGVVWEATLESCTCPGFRTAGHCKHIVAMNLSVDPKSDYSFKADGIQVGKMLQDGSISVIFTTGQYEINNLAPFFLLQGLKDRTFTVTVKAD